MRRFIVTMQFEVEADSALAAITNLDAGNPVSYEVRPATIEERM